MQSVHGETILYTFPYTVNYTHWFLSGNQLFSGTGNNLIVISQPELNHGGKQHEFVSSKMGSGTFYLKFCCPKHCLWVRMRCYRVSFRLGWCLFFSNTCIGMVWSRDLVEWWVFWFPPAVIWSPVRPMGHRKASLVISGHLWGHRELTEGILGPEVTYPKQRCHINSNTTLVFVRLELNIRYQKYIILSDFTP